MKKTKSKALQYISLITGLFISAVAFNLFFRSTRIAYGGSNGIAVIIEIITKGVIDATLTISCFYAITFIIGLIFLGKKVMLKSLLGTILYPIFVSLTAELATFSIIDIENNLLLVYIIGAFLAGVGSGLTYRTGFSGGGTDIFRLMIYKYMKVPLGKAGLIINGIIVIVGAIVTNNYGNVMYAFLILYIMGLVTDKLILGVSASKMFYIIAPKYQTIETYLLEVYGHGLTVIDIKGGHDNKPGKALLAVVPTKEYFKIKEGILAIDPAAFIIVTDAYEVSGGI